MSLRGIAGKARASLSRLWRRPSGIERETWPVAERLAYAEHVIEYLEGQVSAQAALLRHLAAPVIQTLPLVAETKSSFDFQWNEIPSGRYMLDNAAFREEAPQNVCRFTTLSADWFRGKRVIDVGCGLGRYSWALCQLGCDVLSLDQSEHGLKRTAEACRAFPRHRTMKVDLLRPLAIVEQADLVWCFGVLHHTGDTYAAFRHIVPLVKPGGYLYLMIYGEPRHLFGLDYEEVNEYDYWRRRTRNVTLRERLAVVRMVMADGQFRVIGEEHVHGYFDAISPRINDLYAFEELESWLIDAQFVDIRRTVETRNHHIIARRSS
jgi:SAM-dependent methyltransferase